MVAEPPETASAGLSAPGAFHLYALGIYTNNLVFEGVLSLTGLPVEYVPAIRYQRDMDDAAGVGDVLVEVPGKDSPFKTVNTGFSYAPMTGTLNAVFWYNCRNGKTALHYHNTPYRIGNASSQIYTSRAPGSETC